MTVRWFPVRPALRWLDSLEGRGIVPGLERIETVCARLGHPERVFPSVLVAGTNGKGSTVATLEAVLAEAGYRVGLYTSPHLVEITERIRIDRKNVDPAVLSRALEEVREASERAPSVDLTYFEALTAAAFRIFAEGEPDLVLLEVGLGGRLDATNLAPALLSIVTPIGLDHAAFLGATLPEVAREKAGISKPGRAALSAPQEPEVAQVLSAVADEVGASLEFLDSTAIRDVETSLEGTRSVIVDVFDRGAFDVRTPLAGRHQATNVGLALMAARELRALGFDRIDRAAVTRGVASTHWPGRLDRRVVDDRTWILDGAHNPHGAEALARFLDESGLASRVVLVLGLLADKDAAGIAAPLVRRARATIVTAPPGERALAADALLAVARQCAPEATLTLAPDIDAAIAAARGNELVLVAGSLLLVGEALRRVGRDGAPGGA